MDTQVRTYDALVSAIYDCAVDPALWPKTLGLIAQTYGGAYASIHTMRMRPAFEFTAGHHSWHDEEMMVRLFDYFHEIPGAGEIVSAPLDSPFATLPLVQFEHFSKTRFFREWVEPQGLGDSCLTKIGQADNRFVQLSFTTYRSQGTVTSEQLEAMARLAPHLRRAAMICDVIEQQRVMLASYRDTLDRLTCGVVLTDETRRVFHANRVASTMLDEGNVVGVRADRLVATQPQRDQALGDALTKAHRGDAEVQLRGIGIPLHVRAGTPAVCYVLPLNQSEARHVPGGPTVAVFLSVNSESFPIVEAMLSTLYGLTVAEARVASEIGKGGMLRDIGLRMQISENTLKTHLKRVFDKTGVNRQSDLVILLASLFPPVQPLSPATNDSGAPGR